MNASQPNNRDVSHPIASHQIEKPAIGVIATETNSDSIIRVVLRAKRHGYPVLVTHQNEPSLEAISFAKELGARIVDPALSEAADQSYTVTLSKNARQAEFSGLIVHHNVDEYIDYDRSVSALVNADSYSIEAVLKSPTQRSRTLVGIPAYNEGRSIETVVSQARRHVDEVLVVDDGSDDDTSRRAAEAGAIVLEHRRNRGYGETLKTIFREANRRGTDHLVVLDGDGQHNPDDIPRLVETQRSSNAEIVIGSRFEDNSKTELPKYRAFGLWIVNLLTNASMGIIRRNSRIRDTQSGFRVYDGEVIRTLATSNSISSSMDASTDILYHAHTRGYHIEEVGTDIDYNVENGSNHNPLYHGFVLVRNILKTIECQYPLTIFGVPGLASTLIGLGFGYWTVSNFIQTETFPIGLAIITSVLFLAGIFSISTAIILNALKTYHESDYKY
ncbi:glycosyltransferase family 2 protein [Halomontanus rarus]|uniref:glycosyltransferase family 2 protein n=1 Tax=Halomontanus rarus TaxID=3034020 RepID=UPI0023E89C17|nr:glycosyltransferase family 2 protein [Halovivax sp. TS33]